MKYDKEGKTKFVEELRQRIFQWVIRVSDFCESLPLTATTRTAVFQLIKSSTSTGANQRAASRARSQKEFYAKISIAVEEADESHYWLQLIEAKNYNTDNEELKWLIQEADELTRILATARYNAGRKLNEGS